MIVSLDTNILVYAVDDLFPEKQRTARSVIDRLAPGRAPIGLQVIGEFQSVVRRRLRQSMLAAARQAESLLEVFSPFPYGRMEVESALARSAAGVLSYWDALLVSASESAGVDVLLSEDMRDGARHGAVTIHNPFAPDGGLSPAVREILGL